MAYAKGLGMGVLNPIVSCTICGDYMTSNLRTRHERTHDPAAQEAKRMRRNARMREYNREQRGQATRSRAEAKRKMALAEEYLTGRRRPNPKSSVWRHLHPDYQYQRDRHDNCSCGFAKDVRAVACRRCYRLSADLRRGLDDIRARYRARLRLETHARHLERRRAANKSDPRLLLDGERLRVSDLPLELRPLALAIAQSRREIRDVRRINNG